METTQDVSSSGRLLMPEAWRKDSNGDASGPKGRPPRTLTPVEATAALLRGRYTAVVVWHLFWGGKRFYQLVRELDGIPRKAIAHELEELERSGLVRRSLGRGLAKVEYRLTAQGEALKIVVGAMYEWGLRFRGPAPSPEHASL
jgi:DNA-binding HxlR family transcriptional regulator